MKNKKRTLRYQHIWFSIWNAKKTASSQKAETIPHPLRISNK